MVTPEQLTAFRDAGVSSLTFDEAGNVRSVSFGESVAAAPAEDESESAPSPMAALRARLAQAAGVLTGPYQETSNG